MEVKPSSSKKAIEKADCKIEKVCTCMLSRVVLLLGPGVGGGGGLAHLNP